MARFQFSFDQINIDQKNYNFKKIYKSDHVFEDQKDVVFELK